nr:MAG TPA: hypothetical protein [Caudoviricetes sp.]
MGLKSLKLGLAFPRKRGYHLINKRKASAVKTYYRLLKQKSQGRMKKCLKSTKKDEIRQSPHLLKCLTKNSEIYRRANKIKFLSSLKQSFH